MNFTLIADFGGGAFRQNLKSGLASLKAFAP